MTPPSLLMSRRSLLLVAALVAAPVAVRAQTTAIAFGAATSGTQMWAGALGLDFDVNSTITITRLGVFDDDANGLATDKSVRLYDRTTQSALRSLLVPAGSVGTLLGSYRFFDVAPLTLAAGFQGSIVADGFGSADQNYNTYGNPFPGVVDDGGGAIAFVGGSRYDNAADVYPSRVDGGPSVRYGAASFQYVNTVPEPTMVFLVGGGLVALAGIARRRDPR